MNKLNIIYENKEIIVVSKKENYLTIATEKEKTKTLYHEVREYLRKKNQKVFIVHRLDKDTSGLILFAKNEKLKEYLQNNWDNNIRKYVAVVEGNFKGNVALKDYLLENKEGFVYSDKRGKLALTSCSILKKGNNYSLLDIDISTGRKHQIRYQLNKFGYPILGDQKYGHSKAKRMYLHAYYLKVNMPNKTLEFKENIPIEFTKIIK